MYKTKISRILALSVTTAISLTTSTAIAETDNRPSFGAAIIDATELGDLAKVQNLISNGANPNERGEFGTTPLMRAVHNNNLPLVNMLLSSGANTNIGDVGGATAVSMAAREGRNDILAALVRQGANVNSADNEGFTPLMRATLAGNAQAVQTLINAGANLNIGNSFGETALTHAGRENKSEIALILKNHGADNSQLIPAKIANLAKAKPDALEYAEADQADIIVDFSNGKLSNRKIASDFKPASRQIAAVNQKTYYAASFYVPEKKSEPLPDVSKLAKLESIALPQHPQTTLVPEPKMVAENMKWINSLRQVARNAASPYQLASNEMIALSQNSVIELGTFKNEEFANRKINSLKSAFPNIFAELALKSIPKAAAVGIVFEVQAGLTTNAEAKRICKDLVAAGVKCRIANSRLESQQAFNEYKGEVNAATLQYGKTDQPAASPSPQVNSQELAAPTASEDNASPVKRFDAYIANFESRQYSQLSPAAGEEAKPTPLKTVTTQTTVTTTTTAPTSPQATPAPTPVNTAPIPAAGTTPPAPTPLKIIAPTATTPAQSTSTAAPSMPATSTATPAPLAPAPAATPVPAKPIVATPVTNPTKTVEPISQPTAVKAAPESKPTISVMPGPTSTSATVSTNPPHAEVIANDNIKPSAEAPKKVVKKKKYARKRAVPTAGRGEPPRDLSSGQPLASDGHFEVARPVKSADIVTHAPIPLSQQIWIRVSNFANAQAAHDYWESVSSSFSGYRMRTNTNVARPDLTSIEIGPFANVAEGKNACAAISGKKCKVSNTLPPRLVHNLPIANAYVDDHNMPLVENYDMSGGSWNIQLGTYDSYEEAQSAWNSFKAQSKKLRRLQSDIVAMNDKFRLRTGNFSSSSQADALCDSLRTQAISCIIIKN